MSNNSIIETIYPLTPMQQGMLFQTLYIPGENMYFQQFNSEISGPLDINTFKLAWKQVIEKYAVLRSCFKWNRDSEPLQIIVKDVQMSFKYYKWKRMNTFEHNEKIEMFLKEDIELGFNLSKPPLFRLTLIETGYNKYWFTFSHHHLLLDGWSLSNILRDVISLYGAFFQKHNLSLKHKDNYEEYIKWLKQQDMNRAELYWKNAMKGFFIPTSIRLNETDEAKSVGNTYKLYDVIIPERLTDRIKGIAREHQITLNNIIQGIWAILLSKLSNENDIVFGIVVSGRPAEISGVGSMVGLFTNSLPFRVEIKDEEHMIKWLKSINKQLIEARQYEFTPLVKIKEWIKWETELPLFNSIVVFENYPVDDMLKEESYGLKIKPKNYIDRTSYPITIVVMPGKYITINIMYHANKLNRYVLEYFAKGFVKLLEILAHSPDQKIKEYKLPIKMILDAKQHTISHKLKRDYIDITENDSVVRCFEKCAAKYSEKIAVKTEKKTITYNILNKNANRIAHTVLEICKKHESCPKNGLKKSVTALFFEHDADMIMGILGVIKANTIFVSLDPTYPVDRLVYILEDSGAEIIVTNDSNMNVVRELNGKISKDITIVNIDELCEKAPDINSYTAVEPADNIYIMYTSGSTGRSKGVIQNHKNVVSSISRLIDKLHINSDDNIALFSSYSHTVAIIDVFCALFSGAALLPYNLKSQESIEKLPFWLIRESITVLHMVPTVFRYLTDVITNETFPNIRLVILGGETVYRKDIEFYKKIFDDKCLFVNLFGSSEVIIISSYILTKNSEVSGSSVSIGYPDYDVDVLLLNEEGEDTDFFEIGEMYYKSNFLSPGYWSGSEDCIKQLTEPCSKGHAFKSGDLGCLLPDGSIEYKGRKDFQIKIRGHRVELDEIESVMDNFYAINKSVVLYTKNNDNENYLVVYYVCENDMKVDTHELTRFIRRKLPDYMVPSYFVSLDKLPYTQNRKIDRKALLKYSRLTTDDNELMQPKNNVEEKLVEIWKEVLNNKDAIGVNMSLFELGGNSLIITSIISRIKKAFNVDLNISDIFDKQTIAQIACIIQQKTDELEKISNTLEDIEKNSI